MVVAELARRSGRPLCFVQVGSNDGRSNDPLYGTVRTRAWRGVLVEPIPAVFERLKVNYADVPGVAFSNAAIDEREGRTTMYTVSSRPGDPAWADQIASLDRDIVLKHAYAMPNIASRIVPLSVETMTLASLVASHGLDRIDLLHVDAEGLDAQIIGQVPLSAAWTPTYMLFEKKHMDLATRRSLRSRLRAGGYRLVDLGPDEFAYRGRPQA